MTRTEYTAALRKAGFTVRPLWQGRTEGAQALNLTAYEISQNGVWAANMILHDLGEGDGVAAFFDTPHIGAADDIADLQARLRRFETAATNGLYGVASREARS